MFIRSRRSGEGESKTAYDKSVYAAQAWFRQHVTLGGQPYTLDLDQVRAAIDMHRNTIVTARAGSGKTRVIVAKIAYLVAIRHLHLSEIAAFMFNRTAAAEVNQRIGDVKVDGKTLLELDEATNQPITVASTFHKFALDTVKLSGQHPKILVGPDHEAMIKKAFDLSIKEMNLKLSPRDYAENLKLITSFITRAGQKYPGKGGLSRLESDVEQYCKIHEQDQTYREACKIHRLSALSYRHYLDAIHSPYMDFNLLMAEATELICRATGSKEFMEIHHQISKLRFLLIDEYQDFSYLFFAIIQAVRGLCPKAHLFVVGDDWQAINRFAGSNVDYFVNFAAYFPENTINIPLRTNYRSARSIVENANDYMLQYYDPAASRAIPFSHDRGRVYRLNPEKTRFNKSDLDEDALSDGRFILALARTYTEIFPQYKLAEFAHTKPCLAAAQLLKTLYKIFLHHSTENIMLLHRHNFTTYEGITLDILYGALQSLVVSENIMHEANFLKRVRCMTMHKSKGLESDVVILLDFNRDVVLSHHPNASLFSIFGDTIENEKADQHRLIYVALTRAKQKLYILSNDPKSPA